MTTTVSIGLLILRLAVGLTIAGHGAQKAFGWFGGSGFVKQSAVFQGQGLTPGWFWASLAVLGELGGGLSVASGFLTPLGAAGIVGAMFLAVNRTRPNGFWNWNRGYEFPLLLLATAVAIGIAGPGAFALDTLFGLHLSIWVFLVLAVLAVLTDGVAMYLSGRSTAAARAA
ncbi:MAG TPA: DoxX family protein [Ktedonobacterales bacterium]